MDQSMPGNSSQHTDHVPVVPLQMDPCVFHATPRFRSASDACTKRYSARSGDGSKGPAPHPCAPRARAPRPPHSRVCGARASVRRPTVDLAAFRSERFRAGHREVCRVVAYAVTHADTETGGFPWCEAPNERRSRVQARAVIPIVDQHVTPVLLRPPDASGFREDRLVVGRWCAARSGIRRRVDAWPRA